MQQEILFFAPIWGNTLPESEFFFKVKNAGFDGVEMALLGTDKEVEITLQGLHDSNLDLIAQQWQTAMHADFDAHKAEMVGVLERACQVKPVKINTQTGKDFFSFEQNSQLIDIAETIASKYGVLLVHEIHRSRFNAHPLLLKPYLEKFPSIKLTADFSHWCCVCESLLEEQQSMLEEVFPYIRHVHARVGHSQSAQVNDFLAKEHELALAQHLKWWDAIVDLQRKAGIKHITFTPEFGPAPYMQLLPHTNMPVSDQWQQNYEMMRLLKDRYQK